MYLFKISFSFALLFPVFISCSSDPIVEGKILKEVNVGDSIFFMAGTIDEKYFAEPVLSAEIRNQEFELPNKVTYPQMYKSVFKSDRPEILFRGGFYFFDKETRFAVIDTAYECSRIIGMSVNKEYNDRFIPFFYGKMDSPDCGTAPLMHLMYNEKKPVFDSLLLEYVSQYPDSYVALWFLIDRIQVNGYSELRDRIFRVFSQEIKNSNPWEILDKDLSYIRQMGLGHKFPAMALKDTTLNEVELSDIKDGYALVDFWFARCKPCLAAFPKLKELYRKYREKGFEIFSISIDRTDEIGRWKKTIQEQGLNWPQYLDENRHLGKQYNIHSFPTTFLLNQDGIIIKKNASADELDTFLSNNL